MDVEFESYGDNIINYIDNIEFSNTSKEDVIYANRNIVKDNLVTFFSRFKNSNDFSKSKIKIFNKKVEKVYTILLGVTLRYIRFLPNVVKNNCKNYIDYNQINNSTFYNIIANTIMNSKHIHDHMNDLYIVNKSINKNNKTLLIDSKYLSVFLSMMTDVLTISDFKIENVNESNFYLNINSILKLISAYSLKNKIYDKALYPYYINGNNIYRSIKVLHLSKMPDFHLIYERIIELLVENNENIIKTFIVIFRDNDSEKVFIPKSYFNKTKILFHCIEENDDEIYSNEAKLDISKLKEKELQSKIYIKIFGFSTILRYLTSSSETKYLNNERLSKIIEKVQDKLKTS